MVLCEILKQNFTQKRSSRTIWNARIAVIFQNKIELSLFLIFHAWMVSVLPPPVPAPVDKCFDGDIILIAEQVS
jgi:hypothetical protein